MTKTTKTNQEIVYSQGNNWIWAHQTERGSETEELPYWVQSKKEVREYIQDRYNDRGIDRKFRIKWE
jgi:hypothetical protein